MKGYENKIELVENSNGEMDIKLNEKKKEKENDGWYVRSV